MRAGVEIEGESLNTIFKNGAINSKQSLTEKFVSVGGAKKEDEHVLGIAILHLFSLDTVKENAFPLFQKQKKLVFDMLHFDVRYFNLLRVFFDVFHQIYIKSMPLLLRIVFEAYIR